MRQAAICAPWCVPAAVGQWIAINIIKHHVVQGSFSVFRLIHPAILLGRIWLHFPCHFSFTARADELSSMRGGCFSQPSTIGNTFGIKHPNHSCQPHSSHKGSLGFLGSSLDALRLEPSTPILTPTATRRCTNSPTYAVLVIE